MTAPKSAAELSKIWRHNNVPPSDNTGPIDHYADKAFLAGHAAGRESAGELVEAAEYAISVLQEDRPSATKLREALTRFKASET